MAKFLHQIILLTRKNLQTRFSHKCLSFCELGIPLIITACIGLSISALTFGHHGNSFLYEFNTESSAKTPEEYFDCLLNWGYNQYECEYSHDFINREVNMEKVKRLNIQYVISKNVINQGLQQLAEDVMASILKIDLRNDTSIKKSTNWTRSLKSEKELEICVIQKHEECEDMYAAVIITKILDAVEDEHSLKLDYKIRMTDLHKRFNSFFTYRLFIEFSDGYFSQMRDTIDSLYFDYDNKEMDMKIRGRRSGFLAIQAFLDQGIMNYIKSKDQKNNFHNEIVEISLVRMPYIQPPDEKISYVSRFVSLLYSLMISLTIFSLMRVNSEKCSGFKELLRMHGVTIRTQWMGWLLASFIVYSIWTLLLTLLFYVPLVGGPNLLMLLHVNFFLYWLLLLLFAMSITTFSYLVSVFFERVWTAASVGLIIWIMLAVFMTVVSNAFMSIRKWTALGLMLIPTVAFDCSFRFFMSGGGRFRTIASQVIENVELTTLHCLFMLLLDSCIFMTLTIYLDNVLPAKYGVRKPPLYFLRDLRKFLRRITKGDVDYQNNGDDEELNHDSVEMTSIISQDHNQPFQSDPEHLEAAVVIHNLRKQFRKNKKRAVDGLSTKMYTGEIFALLGFNGAGKTTTIGVLTGLMSPTNGMARIFDFDIRKDMEEIRKYIGLCPQHNLLFDEMSVLKQVAFFGKLKGLEQPLEKAKELLKWLGMSDKFYNKPEQLSGGQKRKVHLAIALIGDTKLAFLDEPTSGLDPETRRGVWDILEKLRGKVTVILTTHDMEEADVLGDRIGIMSEGKMICSGTPSFLKKYYGVGYNLKMSKLSPDCDQEKVYTMCREYVPNAKLNFDSGTQTSTISISIPTAELDLTKVADLLDTLRSQRDQLGVENIGLSLSTMDEVFLKVGEAVQAVSATVPMTNCDTQVVSVSSSRYVGARLLWYRFTSLVFKRMMYFCSSPFTLLSLIIFFAVALWVSLTSLSYSVNQPNTPDPPLVVSSSSLSAYKYPVLLLHDSENFSSTRIGFENQHTSMSFSVSYLNQLHLSTQDSHPIEVKEFPKNSTFQDIMLSLKKTSLEDLHHYRQNFLVGASFNVSSSVKKVNGFYSVYALHSAPLSFNLISQAMIKKMYGVDADIGVTNHPFQRTDNYNHISSSYVKSVHTRKSHFYVKCGGVILLVVISSLLTGTSALLPTEERLNKGKQLQLMTGTSPFLYWMSMFTWDFLFFSLVNVVITLVYILADYVSGNWIYTNNGAGAIIFMILECHAFAALWFCYLISWAPCIKTASDSFLIVNKLAIIVGVLWNIINFILISITIEDVREGIASTFEEIVLYASIAVGYVAWIDPMFSLFLSMLKLGMVSIPNSICNWFPEEVLHLSCDESGGKNVTLDEFLQSCCPNCKNNCFEPEPYFNISSIELHNGHYTHSMVFDILNLVMSGGLSAAVLFALEYFLPRLKAEKKVKKSAGSSDSSDNERLSNATVNTAQEEDVVNEALRVDDIVEDNAIETANHALVVQNLHLEFGKLTAVNGLSFGVHRGECFGLLGVNGAGKTSTFRMLTGDIFPSCGNMYSGGLNIYKHRDAYLSSLGYCPQFDGIIGSLTGLQMVKLYGALRGIPPERLKEDAAVWLDKFGLLGSANKKCGHYSGGMKRRLSAAMALIGNPKLLLLDEPTTGVDPAFRRQFWNVIREIRESGQAVVLTSHTMDECEALCTRLGIMVDGQFKCLGNIQHLKSKFGKGFILTIKLKRVPEDEEELNEEKVKLLMNEVVGALGLCVTQTKQKALIQYQILTKALWYSDIFRTMERIREMPGLGQVVEEYYVTETSLEDVFISFAHKK